VAASTRSSGTTASAVRIVEASASVPTSRGASRCGRNNVEEAQRLAAELLRAPEPPVAVVAMSDQQAIGVLRAAAELGLTTVAQSLREQGEACAGAAFGEEPADFAAAWSVVIRGSTHR
jgi:ABC-type sugar transport system substrate-binding protein